MTELLIVICLSAVRMKKFTILFKVLKLNIFQGLTKALTRRKSTKPADDVRSELSLNVNTGVFEKSLTMEEEKRQAKARR